MLYLVRYGELALKNVRAREFFERCLVSDIQEKAKALDRQVEVRRERGRIFVKGNCRFLKHTFGVVSYSVVKTCAPSEQAIEKAARTFRIRPTETFAISASRNWKGFPLTSRELDAKLGASVAARTKAKVNLTKPDRTIFVEVHEDAAYLFSEKLPGPGGLPLGSGGKVVALARNWTDVLACWMMMKRGCRPVVVECGASLTPLERCVPKLKVRRLTDESMSSIIRLARGEKATALVTGEPLGLYKDEILTFRPLVGFNSEEIAVLAKRAGVKFKK